MKLSKSNKLMLGRLLVFLILSFLTFTVLVAACSCYIWLSTGLHGFSFGDTYTYKIGMESTSERRLETIEFEFGDVSDAPVLYVNFTALQEYCGFYESGDRKVHRFILPSDRSEFTVTAGSNRADLNGNTVYMEAPAVIKGDSLYLPLSFIDHYIIGITVEKDVNEVKSEETGEMESVVDEYTYIIRCSDDGAYSLLLGTNEPTAPIDKSVLD